VPSSSDRAEHPVKRIRVGELTEDFHGNGALTSDDERMVVRRDVDELVLGDEALAFGFGLVEVFAVKDDFGAKTLDIAPFDGRRGERHDNGGGDAELEAGEGNSLSVVT
jgi:hypothetical protein